MIQGACVFAFRHYDISNLPLDFNEIVSHNNSRRFMKEIKKPNRLMRTFAQRWNTDCLQQQDGAVGLIVSPCC